MTDLTADSLAEEIKLNKGIYTRSVESKNAQDYTKFIDGASPILAIFYTSLH